MEPLETRQLLSNSTPFIRSFFLQGTGDVAVINLNDSDASTVDSFLTKQAAASQPLAVEVLGTDTLSTSTINSIFGSHGINYIFADYESSDAVSRTTTLIADISAVSGYSTRISAGSTLIGNFGLATIPTDPTDRPGSTHVSDNSGTDPYMTTTDFRNSGAKMAIPDILSGDASFRTPLLGTSSSTGGSNAPNSLSALFTLPITRLSIVSANIGPQPNIPVVSRFDNYSDSALQNGTVTSTDDQVLNSWDQTTGGPNNGGQMMSRGDFEAFMLHLRMRGASGYMLSDPGVFEYDLATEQTDAEAGWNNSVVSSVLSGTNGRPATLGATVKFNGTLMTFENAGVAYSAVTNDNTTNKQLAIVVSNLSNTDGTVSFNTRINGDTLSYTTATMAQGTHKILLFTASGGSWVYQSTSDVFDTSNSALTDRTVTGASRGGPYPTPTLGLNVKFPFAFDSSTYSAYGDGVHDDTDALQAAIYDSSWQSFARNLRENENGAGGIVYLPAGNYLISAPLIVPSGTMIEGESSGDVTITYDPTSFESGEPIFILTSSGGYTGWVDIKNLTLVNHDGGSGIRAYNLGATSYHNTLENLVISTDRVGIDLGSADSQNTIISNVDFHDFGSGLIKIRGTDNILDGITSSGTAESSFATNISDDGVTALVDMGPADQKAAADYSLRNSNVGAGVPADSPIAAYLLQGSGSSVLWRNNTNSLPTFDSADPVPVYEFEGSRGVDVDQFLGLSADSKIATFGSYSYPVYDDEGNFLFYSTVGSTPVYIQNMQIPAGDTLDQFFHVDQDTPNRPSKIRIGSVIYSDGADPTWTAATYNDPASGAHVNAADFGAVSSGTSDQSAALQAAINAIAPFGGIVDINRGTYLLSTSLSLYSGVALRGESAGTALITRDTNTSDGLIVLTPASGSDTVTGATVEDLALFSGSVAADGQDAAANGIIAASASSPINVEDLNVRHVYTCLGGYGVYLPASAADTSDSVINDMAFEDAGSGAVLLDGDSNTVERTQFETSLRSSFVAGTYLYDIRGNDNSFIDNLVDAGAGHEGGGSDPSNARTLYVTGDDFVSQHLHDEAETPSDGVKTVIDHVVGLTGDYPTTGTQLIDSTGLVFSEAQIDAPLVDLFQTDASSRVTIHELWSLFSPGEIQTTNVTVDGGSYNSITGGYLNAYEAANGTALLSGEDFSDGTTDDWTVSNPSGADLSVTTDPANGLEAVKVTYATDITSGFVTLSLSVPGLDSNPGAYVTFTFDGTAGLLPYLYLNTPSYSGGIVGQSIDQLIGPLSSSDDTLTFVFRTSDGVSTPMSGTIYLSGIQVYTEPDAPPADGIYVGLLT